jgi:hypothetical protein
MATGMYASIEAVESVLVQTWTPVEAVVLGDGLPDDTDKARLATAVSNAFDWKKIGEFPRLVMPVFAPAASCRFTLEISPGMICSSKGPFLAVRKRPR